ncbi:hypothetical protein [Neobacillus sp. D3-1R]|uniref:hypothetical protein n=1 Tax=Neobacillus sp. D3-1R TaxID=3445778 RepID=UPI003F9F3C32
MSSPVDLNKLRNTILSSQARNQSLPSDPERKIMVSKEGKILDANSSQIENPKQLSEVHQGVFAAVSRLEYERKIVQDKFPKNTRMIEVDGIRGWYYSFRDEFEQHYEMYAYFDGNAYQVKVVHPEVEGKYNSVHECHLYRDGRICFGNQYAGGLPSLEIAFAKSVLWANGFTAFEHTKKYPFSTNNL